MPGPEERLVVVVSDLSGLELVKQAVVLVLWANPSLGFWLPCN